MTVVFKAGVWDKKDLTKEIERIIEGPGTTQLKARNIVHTLGQYRVIAPSTEKEVVQ